MRPVCLAIRLPLTFSRASPLPFPPSPLPIVFPPSFAPRPPPAPQHRRATFFHMPPRRQPPRRSGRFRAPAGSAPLATNSSLLTPPLSSSSLVRTLAWPVAPPPRTPARASPVVSRTLSHLNSSHKAPISPPSSDRMSSGNIKAFRPTPRPLPNPVFLVPPRSHARLRALSTSATARATRSRGSPRTGAEEEEKPLRVAWLRAGRRVGLAGRAEGHRLRWREGRKYKRAAGPLPGSRPCGQRGGAGDRDGTGRGPRPTHSPHCPPGRFGPSAVPALPTPCDSCTPTAVPARPPAIRTSAPSARRGAARRPAHSHARACGRVRAPRERRVAAGPRGVALAARVRSSRGSAATLHPLPPRSWPPASAFEAPPRLGLGARRGCPSARPKYGGDLPPAVIHL